MRILVFLIFPLICFSQDNLRYANTINKKDLFKHISVFSSDSLEGRETGKPGQKKAAKYIIESFKGINIPPYKRKKYTQKFALQIEPKKSTKNESKKCT